MKLQKIMFTTSVYLKLLMGGEDCPLSDDAVLESGSEPLLVPASLATDILSTIVMDTEQIANKHTIYNITLYYYYSNVHPW